MTNNQQLLSASAVGGSASGGNRLPLTLPVPQAGAIRDTQYAAQKWYVLYTKSRHEKLVESQLPEKGIEAFTPKITIKKRWSDRVQTIEEPLFKSYCFARFSLYDKRTVLSQRGVVKVIHFNGQYIPVEDCVIDSLKILISSKLKIDPCPYLKQGQRVFIKTGPLKGLEGFISEKRKNNTELVISVDAIGASVKCVVDIDGVDLA